MSRSLKVFSLSLAKGTLVFVQVVSGMFFSRFLTVADYGTYLQTFLAYEFAVPILTLGLPSVLYYFLPRERHRKRGVVLDNILVITLAGFVYTLFMLVGGTELLANRFNNPDLHRTLKWMVFYPLYTFPILISSAVWVSVDKAILNALYNVITGIALTIALIIAVLFTRDYEAPTIIRIIFPLFCFPFAMRLFFKHIPGKWNKPSLLSMLEMVKFAIPLGIASIFGTLAIQIAGIIVSFLTSPEEYAIYANGAKEVPFIGIVTGSISVVILADMAKKIEEGELTTALELFRKAAAISASFLFPIMIILMIFSESFIDILYSSRYKESVLPFRIYLLMIPIRIAYYGSAFIALGRTKLVLYRSFIDLCLTVIFCYFFVLWFGAYGAALGLVLTMFFWTVPFNLYSLSKCFMCKPANILPFGSLYFILMISFLSAIIPSFLLFLKLKPIFEFSFGFSIYMVVYIALSFRFNAEFRDVVSPFLRKVPYLNSYFSKL
jgi:O-antigen/teichoic acid export membrane protein